MKHLAMWVRGVLLSFIMGVLAWEAYTRGNVSASRAFIVIAVVALGLVLLAALGDFVDSKLLGEGDEP